MVKTDLCQVFKKHMKMKGKSLSKVNKNCAE